MNKYISVSVCSSLSPYCTPPYVPSPSPMFLILLQPVISVYIHMLLMYNFEYLYYSRLSVKFVYIYIDTHILMHFNKVPNIVISLARMHLQQALLLCYKITNLSTKLFARLPHLPN